MRERVSAIIEGAAFTADEFDTATSGECGTFALSLFASLQARGIPCKLLMVAENNGKGQPRYTSYGRLCWRHGAVVVEGKFFDMRGEQEWEWMNDEFAWGTTHGGLPLELEPVEFFIQLQDVYGEGIPAFDEEYYQNWKKRLDEALTPFTPVLL